MLLLLGLQALLLPVLLGLASFWAHHKWRHVAARRDEIRRLVETVSREDSELALYGKEYSSSPSLGPTQFYLPTPHQQQEFDQKQRFFRCALCLSPTTTRCSRCKAVRYCSGKCQIIHWRQGHKDECQPVSYLKPGREYDLRQSSEVKPSRIVECEGITKDCFSEGLVSSGTCRTVEPLSDESGQEKFETGKIAEEMQATKLPHAKHTKAASCDISDLTSCKMKKTNPHNIEEAECKSDLPNGKLVGDVRPKKVRNKSIRRTASSELLFTDASSCSPPSSWSRLDSLNEMVEDGARMVRVKDPRSVSFHDSINQSQDSCESSKPSVWNRVQRFKALRSSHKNKMIFPYERFVELYSYCEELCPFGLINCGNSCYANAVLQCLTFTRPLTSYLSLGLHSAACRMKDWCFMCEFEILILKGRGGESPLSPIRILSKVEKFGCHVGRGTEEDAHEFLRYAVDTMQSVFLKEAGDSGPLAEETTLIGLTFGGYLRSKITCMRCLGKSERCERMMDLTVEVGRNIRTLDEAFAQFTAEEVLDGENKYCCGRCKLYVKAKKKLTILEAPNILTIVLKRFQTGNFRKLDSTVRFPEVFDVAPYMHGQGDKSSKYSLYAVVAHRGTFNDASSGHYVCYVRNFHGGWFGINDSMVIPVEPERVLLEEAYMLLYARHCPKGPALLSSNDLRKMNLEAIPSRLEPSNATTNSHLLTMNHSRTQLKHGKYPVLSHPDELTSNKLRDPDDRGFGIPRPTFMDSSSESSSLFSCSDASSCSTISTKDSVRGDDASDFPFGEVETGWYSHSRHSYDSAPDLYRNLDSESLRKRDTWRQPNSVNSRR